MMIQIKFLIQVKYLINRASCFKKVRVNKCCVIHTQKMRRYQNGMASIYNTAIKSSNSQFKQQHNQYFADQPLVQNLQSSRFQSNGLNSTINSQKQMQKRAQSGDMYQLSKVTGRLGSLQNMMRRLINHLGLGEQFQNTYPHYRIQKKELQNSNCGIQQNLQYQQGSKDLIKSFSTSSVLFKNMGTININFLNLLNFFSLHFRPQFNGYMKNVINVFRQMELMDDQIMQYLAFAFYLLANSPDCSPLLQIKGPICIKYLFKPQSVSKRYLDYLDQQVVFNFENCYKNFKRNYGRCSNFYLVIIQMLTNLGYHSFIKQDKVRLIIKRHIKYLFLGSVNLWKEGQYLLISMILRILKPVQRKEYDRLKKCIEESSSFQKHKVEYIIQTLEDVQIQKYMKKLN